MFQWGHDPEVMVRRGERDDQRQEGCVSMGPRPGGHGKGKHFATLMHSDKNPFCANLRHFYHSIHKRAPLLGHHRYAEALHGRFFQLCRLISMGFLRGGSRKKLGLFQALVELSISVGRNINAYRFYRCHALGIASSIRLDRMAFEISSKGLINPEAFLYAVDLTANKLFPPDPAKPPLTPSSSPLSSPLADITINRY